MNTRYFWNSKKYNSYEDLLSSICDCIYEKRAITEQIGRRGHNRRYQYNKVIGHKHLLMSYQNLIQFFKKFRHKDDDGIYHKAYNKAIYRQIVHYDENGKARWSSEVDYYITVPAHFDQKPWIVKDSHGRTINSRDLRLDALAHVYDPNWNKRKCRPYEYRGYSTRKGGWQKYAGSHAGTVGDCRKNIHHLNDKQEVLKRFGKAFKIRGKRTAELRRINNWCGQYGWIEKGWKQTRKQKQWM